MVTSNQSNDKSLPFSATLLGSWCKLVNLLQIFPIHFHCPKQAKKSNQWEYKIFRKLVLSKLNFKWWFHFLGKVSKLEESWILWIFVFVLFLIFEIKWKMTRKVARNKKQQLSAILRIPYVVSSTVFISSIEPGKYSNILQQFSFKCLLHDFSKRSSFHSYY